MREKERSREREKSKTKMTKNKLGKRDEGGRGGKHDRNKGRYKNGSGKIYITIETGMEIANK